MATDPIARESEDVPDPGVPRRSRRPFYRDPLSLLSWSVALAALLAYWFFFVRQPRVLPGQPIARVTSVAGTVTVKPIAGAAWLNVKLSDVLRVGDVVQTRARSGAEISFDSGSVVHVRPDSVVYIGGSAESSTAAWSVQSGRVSFSVATERQEIRTPTASTTAMQSATGAIDVAESGETGVKVFQGRAEIQTKQGQTITLGENQAVRVDASGRAGARLALPPPPSLVSPTLRAQLPRVAPPAASAELRWTAVANGVTYRVAVDYNVTQANLLLSAALEETLQGTAHDLTGLEPGRYFWRVAAVNRDGLEGAFSRTSFFTVVAPAAPAPSPSPSTLPPPALLSLQSVEAIAPGIVHVAGRAEPGATVEVAGVAVLVLPDGSFSEYLRHSEGDRVVVKARSRSGAVAEESRPVARR